MLIFPLARVLYTADKAPDIIKSYPEVENNIIHVCINDISKSKVLKHDFTQQCNILKSFRGKINICGPIPTYGRGMENLHSLISVNTWLSSAFGAFCEHFIDNFYIFWTWGNFFGPGGLHLNNLASGIPQRNHPYHPATFMTRNDQSVRDRCFTFNTGNFYIRLEQDIFNISVIITYTCPMRFAVK